MRFAGKVALVTGGRMGIGLAIARRLRDDGARVFTAQRGEDAEIESVPADFADPDCPAELIGQVAAQAGRLDIQVNNAGFTQDARAEDTALADWNRMIAGISTAPFLLIKAALPNPRVVRGASVNIGSIEGIGCNPLHAAYSATRAGLQGLTRAIAVDHGAEGIRCNAVAPGWIDTDLAEANINSFPGPSAFRDNIGRIHPFGRTGKTQDVTALVA